MKQGSLLSISRKWAFPPMFKGQALVREEDVKSTAYEDSMYDVWCSFEGMVVGRVKIAADSLDDAEVKAASKFATTVYDSLTIRMC